MSCSSARFLRKNVLWFCRRSANLKTKECRWAPYRMNTGRERTDRGRRLQTCPASHKYPVTRDFRRGCKVSRFLTRAVMDGTISFTSVAGFTPSHQRCFRTLPGKSLIRGQLPALKALVCPHIPPISIASAVGDTEIVKIAVDRLKGSRAIEVENDIGVGEQHRLAAQDTVILAEDATATEIANHGLNPVIG